MTEGLGGVFSVASSILRSRCRGKSKPLIMHVGGKCAYGMVW
ncbi:unnamed protein product [Brassica rapa]|nr:unnamed protein product [Brassica rapa]